MGLQYCCLPWWNIIMSHSSLVFFLLCVYIFLQAQANFCAPQNIAWTGNDVKVIDDCDILKKKVTVHLDRLTTRRPCLQSVVVEMTNSEVRSKKHLGNPAPGNQRTISFENPLARENRCLSTSVSLTAKVYSTGQPQEYFTTFDVFPQFCTGVYEILCSDKESVINNATNIPSSENVSSDFSLQLVAVAISGALILALLVPLVLCLVKYKRRRTFQRKPKVDINDTYGTYDITGEM